MELNVETAKFVRNVLIGSVVIGLCNSVHLYTNYANQVKDIFYFTQTNSKYSLRSGSRNSVGASFYRPQTKLREGNVLTCVCQSVRGGVVPPPPNHTPSPGTIPPRPYHTPRDRKSPQKDNRIQLASRRYTSYWNAFVLLPTNEVWGKVMFLHLSDILFTGVVLSRKVL